MDSYSLYLSIYPYNISYKFKGDYILMYLVITALPVESCWIFIIILLYIL